MGRRYKGNVAEQEKENLGIPGKFYFTPPKALEIVAKKEPMTPRVTPQGGNPLSPLNPGNGIPKLGPNYCRLRSSWGFQGYEPPEDLEYQCSKWPNPMEILHYLKTKRIEGYGEGAVVVRRHQPEGNFKAIYKWGMILIEMKETSHQGNQWNPYTVKWIGDNLCEPAWAEDLVIIHSCLDDGLLDDLLEAQGVI